MAALELQTGAAARVIRYQLKLNGFGSGSGSGSASAVGMRSPPVIPDGAEFLGSARLPKQYRHSSRVATDFVYTGCAVIASSGRTESVR